MASAGLDPHLFGTHSTVPNKGPSFYGRTAISRTLFETDAVHINFEINTDGPSCESYISEQHDDHGAENKGHRREQSGLGIAYAKPLDDGRQQERYSVTCSI